jgi:ubiquitin C-terminal hydrolase
LAYEKPSINKALTNESRTACYKLLMTITNIYTEFAELILAQYWGPLLEMIEKPKKPAFNPRTEQRSHFDFSGIKNLGAICYMSSMIQ